MRWAATGKHCGGKAALKTCGWTCAGYLCQRMSSKSRLSQGRELLLAKHGAIGFVTRTPHFWHMHGHMPGASAWRSSRWQVPASPACLRCAGSSQMSQRGTLTPPPSILTGAFGLGYLARQQRTVIRPPWQAPSKASRATRKDDTVIEIDLSESSIDESRERFQLSGSPRHGSKLALIDGLEDRDAQAPRPRHGVVGVWADQSCLRIPFCA